MIVINIITESLHLIIYDFILIYTQTVVFIKFIIINCITIIDKFLNIVYISMYKLFILFKLIKLFFDNSV